MARKAQPEQIIHRAIADYLELVSKVEGFWFTSFPGGGKRSKVEAAIFKGLGVKAGVADILIVSNTGRAHWIEVKTPTTYLRKNQKEFREEMAKRNSPFAVARSVDDAKAALSEWGII